MQFKEYDFIHGFEFPQDFDLRRSFSPCKLSPLPASTDPAKRVKTILESSRRIFREKGALGMRISEIAKDVGISVGTFYAHFGSKEDLLMAMSHECLKQRILGFQESFETPDLNPAEKVILSVFRNFLFSFDHPHLYAIERVVMSPSVWEEASEETRKVTNDEHVVITTNVREQLEHAIEQGHVRSRGELSKQSANMLVGFWSIATGSSQVARIRYTMGDEAPLARRLPDGFQATVKAFMVGSGWTSSDPDGDTQRLAEIALGMEVMAC